MIKEELGVASASVGTDQTGLPAVDLVLTPDATGLFAAYTADHVGDYFAIVLDGTVITAPVILEAISDGRLTISMARAGSGQGTVDNLVAIVKSGSLPFPLQEVAFGP